LRLVIRWNSPNEHSHPNVAAAADQTLHERPERSLILAECVGPDRLSSTWYTFC